MVMTLQTVRNAVEVYQNEGATALQQAAKRRLCEVGPTARARDAIVRRLALDQWTLPYHERFIPIYEESVRTGDEKYELIRSHTRRHYDGQERVLEIGCGSGNLTAAFARRNTDLRYVGIEPQLDFVEALQRRYRTTPYQFTHVDLQNDHYNPDGDVDPTAVTFDAGSEFDLVVLCSVFTHVRPATMVNYLQQFDDLLADDGKVWATAYLITDEEDKYLKDDRDFDVAHEDAAGEFWSPYEDTPEQSIAHPEAAVRERVADAGLDIDDVVYGSWRGGEYEYSRDRFYQDIMVIR